MNEIYTLQSVFLGRMFQVPDYQRGYAWEEKNWVDLIQDLELLPSERNHFTGTLVLRKNGRGAPKFKDEEGQVYDMFDVIDGQQRLATVVLLLDAIHDEMRRLDLANLANGLKKMYLAINDLNGQPHTRLRLNRDSQEYFYNNVLGFKPDIAGPAIRSHRLLQDAHVYFDRYLAKQSTKQGPAYPDWLRELYFKVTQHLTVLLYEVENELDAGIIFETMNDRGKPLTELEKVKNYLLYLASKLDLPTPHDLHEQVNATWTHIFEELMTAGLSGVEDEDQLLRVHWLMAYNYNPKAWEQSRSIKTRFSLRDYQERHAVLLQEIGEYLDTLRNAVTAYCDIHRPRRAGAFNEVDFLLRARIVETSEKLTRLGERGKVRATFLPLLIAVRLKAGDDGLTYLQTIELCEKFDFRVYQWMRYRAFAAQSTFFRIGADFFKKPDATHLLAEITATAWNYCTNAQFDERFARETENWYQWGGLKYFLYEDEQRLATERREPVHFHWEDLWDTRRDTIEHILPQTPTTEWIAAFPDENSRKRWLHDIGNLTLTYDNSYLLNKTFPAKKGHPAEANCYASSSFFVERQLAGYEAWNEAQVKDRREKLRAWAGQRWHIPEPQVAAGVEASEALAPGEHLGWLADKNGVGEEYQAILNAAGKHNIHLRPHKWCMVCAPASKKTGALFTVWPQRERLFVQVWFTNFKSLLGFPESRVRDILGPEQDQRLTGAEADDFIDRLDQVFTEFSASK